MPPGAAYNWLATAHSLAQILEHAAQYRASQVSGALSHSTRTGAAATEHEGTHHSQPSDSLRRANDEWMKILAIPVRPIVLHFQPSRHSLSLAPEVKTTKLSHDASTLTRKQPMPIVLENELFNPTPSSSNPASVINSSETPNSRASRQPMLTTPVDEASIPISSSSVPSTSNIGAHSMNAKTQERPNLSDSILPSSTVPEATLLEPSVADLAPLPTARTLQSSRVPSSRIGRFFHYGGLAASLSYGAASELISGRGTSGSLMMTEANISRLVSKLSQMRGAALKVGQFLSIQDTHVLPPEVEKIFRRVQDGAHYMPNWQMEKVMSASFGASWRDNFASFEAIPFAAASIGQVHRAVLAAAVSPTGKDERVAVKVQFPNIQQSVESDIGYLKVLLTAGQLLPKGLFLDKTIAAMKDELADECDYVREGSFMRLFGDADHFAHDARFKVPWVWDASSRTVLVMEHVDGQSVGGELIAQLPQQDKDDIAARIIELCLRELFRFRAMQTDPNWTNFLWNARTRQIELVDFGATRTYSAHFMDNWLRLLRAAAAGDHEACVQASLALGYLTGKEDEAMVAAHVKSMQLLATPFRADTTQPYAFGPGSDWAGITKEIRGQIPVMLQHRLTPPPKETYSLNRKLSGAFLLASRLGARVDCRKLWEETTSDYVFGKE